MCDQAIERMAFELMQGAGCRPAFYGIDKNYQFGSAHVFDEARAWTIQCEHFHLIRIEMAHQRVRSKKSQVVWPMWRANTKDANGRMDMGVHGRLIFSFRK